MLCLLSWLPSKRSFLPPEPRSAIVWHVRNPPLFLEETKRNPIRLIGCRMSDATATVSVNFGSTTLSESPKDRKTDPANRNPTP